MKLARLLQHVLGNPEILMEATWDWLISDKGQHLFVDIYIPEYKLCIEYQGQQHYFYPNYFHKSYKDFLDQRRRDKTKRDLLKKHGYRYLAWRYSEPLTIKQVVKRLEKLGIPVSPEIKAVADKAPEPAPKRRRRKVNRSKKPRRRKS